MRSEPRFRRCLTVAAAVLVAVPCVTTSAASRGGKPLVSEEV